MNEFSSLFEVRLAREDDIPYIMDITHEVCLEKYTELAGLSSIAALSETL